MHFDARDREIISKDKDACERETIAEDTQDASERETIAGPPADPFVGRQERQERQAATRSARVTASRRGHRAWRDRTRESASQSSVARVVLHSCSVTPGRYRRPEQLCYQGS